MTDSPDEKMPKTESQTGNQDLTISASDEMEAALREATEALEANEAEESCGATEVDASSSTDSTDKMTIELLSQELQNLKNLHEEKIEGEDEQKDQHLRLQAEFDNFRRRSLKEKQESFKFGHENLVKDLLSTVDNLERAVEHGAQSAGEEVRGILDGVELVLREILGALAKHAVTEIAADGQIFDPAFHEALGQIPNGEVPANTVLQVLQKGYLIHDRMLRPARVIVAREPTAEEAGQAETNE